MRKTIRVVICNNYALFREGIKALFRGSSGIEIVGEAQEGHEVIRMAKELKPDVILMDVALPDMSGFEATRIVKQADDDVKILILTMYDDPTLISKCLDAGASGYILKDARSNQLADAIDTVGKGGDYRSPRAA